MKNGTQGFTLIELLIVIAIIGILAAVLIPNLLNARTSANARAAQAHSANVYKAAVATLADSSSATQAAVITALSPCMTAKAVAAAVPYGYSAAPSGVTSCVITANGANDFSVTVATNASAGSKTFVNGNEGTPATP